MTDQFLPCAHITLNVPRIISALIINASVESVKTIKSVTNMECFVMVYLNLA